MSNVFFSSGIDGLSRDVIVKNYNSVEVALAKRGHIIVNPVSFYFSKNFITQIDNDLGEDKAVVQNDLKALRKADIMLMNVSDPCRQYIGCICEMVYANIYKIPVVAYIGKATQFCNRPFFSFHCARIVENLETALDFLDILAKKTEGNI